MVDWRGRKTAVHVASSASTDADVAKDMGGKFSRVTAWHTTPDHGFRVKTMTSVFETTVGPCKSRRERCMYYSYCWDTNINFDSSLVVSTWSACVSGEPLACRTDSISQSLSSYSSSVGVFALPIRRHHCPIISTRVQNRKNHVAYGRSCDAFFRWLRCSRCRQVSRPP